MAYSKYYLEGWKDNEDGGTPINAAALNNMEAGISAAHEFMARTDNPHGVTKAQVGLGNVPNVATNNQVPTFTMASTLTGLVSGEKLSVSLGKIAKAVSDLITHIAEQGEIDAEQNKKISILQTLITNVDTTIKRSASGNPVSFDDGADNIPVESLTVTLPVTQSGTGTPSPDNIRPFEGVDSVTVTRKDGNDGNAQSVTVPLASAGTVYGGNLNVSTGVLTVTHFQVTFTGNESWSTSGSGDGAIYFANFSSPAALNTAISTQHFSCFSAASVTTSNTTKGARFASSTRIYVRPDFDTFPSTTSFRNWVRDMHTAGTPLQGVAAFADPVTYQLTPQEVRTLFGENVITSTAGTVTVNYHADPSLAYQSLEANLTNAILSLGAGI